MADYGRNDPGARSKAQNRATVQQLKLIGQSHPTGLTVNLLKLFEPREPLEHKPPLEKRKLPTYHGVGQFVDQFAGPGDPEYAPPKPKVELPAERKQRIKEALLEKGAQKVLEDLETYDPANDPGIDGDPYKTLFVARTSYETTEQKLKREFEAYGSIKKVRLVNDKFTDKPRGYGFVEFHHTRDMKTAYKQADGRKIDNRRVIVDVERGRTVPNWRPRRLGGGLGSTRIGSDEMNSKHSGRDPIVAAAAPRGEEPPREPERRPEAREPERPRAEKEKSRERDVAMEDPEKGEAVRERPRDRDPEEKEKERDRERRDRDRERHRGDKDRDKDRDRHRDRDRERGDTKERDRERGRDRERSGRDRDRDRERDKGRERERERDRDPEREVKDRGERSRSRERERERDR